MCAGSQAAVKMFLRPQVRTEALIVFMSQFIAS